MTCDQKEKERRFEAMLQIKDEIMDLKESPFYEFRIKPVIGEGDYCAKIMLVGEAPGKNESLQGRPFCGASGRILDELLDNIKLVREKVYITNIVKDRPPNNRDPLPAEIDLYAPFLDRQIKIIKPRVLVALGRLAMIYLMEKYGLAEQVEPISRAHGKVYEIEMDYGPISLVIAYHPAVAVYNGNMKESLRNDFRVINALIK